MKQVKVTIEGIVPILFNPMTQELQEDISIGGDSGKKTPEQYRDRASKRVYRDSEGNLGCPAQNIKKCIRLGAVKSSLKYGRKGLDSFLEALMFIEPQTPSFGLKDPDFIDERSGRIPPGPRGKRVMLYRAGLNAPWQLSFTIIVVDDRIPLESIKVSLEQSGILCGLCDYRPEFGRFRVINWEESNGG